MNTEAYIDQESFASVVRDQESFTSVVRDQESFASVVRYQESVTSVVRNHDNLLELSCCPRTTLIHDRRKWSI